MKKYKKITNKALLLGIISLSILIGMGNTSGRFDINMNMKESGNTIATSINAETKTIYLSDLDYITDHNWSYNGWSGHSIGKNKNQEGGNLSLIIDGTRRYFSKGLSVHAKGQVVYDISQFSTKYPRFIAQIGVDGSRGTNGSIWFQFYASNDGQNWTSLLKTETMTGSTPAETIDLNVEGYKYLRIYVDPAGSNAADHGTLGNARLVPKDFDESAMFYDKLHNVEYYDNILKNCSVEENYNNNYRLVLERAFVQKMGYWNLQDLAEHGEGIYATLDWLLENNERLEQIIEVGEISNPIKFLQIISDIYNKYTTEFHSENSLIYTKMAVGLAAAYTTDAIMSPLRFGAYSANYDYVERFTLMKQLFDENKFMRFTTNGKSGNLVPNDWFKDFHVELIRMIMNDGIRGDELIWLNAYTHYRKSFSEGMVPYISPNYNQKKLYAEENRATYNKKYLLDQYGVPYNDGIQRYWMVFEAGGICWDQSRIGQTMWKVNGLPAVGAYQPGHEMYFTYYQDDAGNGYWSERYGNYNSAGTTWGGGQRKRLIFNWGAKYFTDQNIGGSKGGTSLGYLYLAQANLNNYDKYKKSVYYNLIANSYSDDNQKLETYFKSLEVNDINLDTYDFIISLYKNMSNKNGGTITSNDWYELALKVTDGYAYYPVAMYDLLKVVRPYLEGEKKLAIDTLEKEKLNAAKNVSNSTLNSIGAVNAGSGVRTHATRLLGQTQPNPVSFSFDGENAGKIILHPNYSIMFAYSLDGGVTFSEYIDEASVTLSEEEIKSINETDDIIIRFMGLTYTFTIDITKGQISNTLYANDLENRVIGIGLTYEWRNSEDEEWTSYAVASPNNTGDKVLYVRNGATGTKTASEVATFRFTADHDTDSRKYIPISHLSVSGYSTQSVDSGRPFYAPNAIDGNIHTIWHTDFRYNVITNNQPAYFIIELDSLRYISALEFIQTKYKVDNPDYIKNVRVLVSQDGENWIEAGSIENCPRDTQLRTITFDKSVYGKFVKLDIDTYDMFASLAMVNLYEDITREKPSSSPTAGIGYSVTSPTTENVVARLINPNTEIKVLEILDKNGKVIDDSGSLSYTFTENGEVKFKFIDIKTGVEGFTKAKVDWIDRTAPTGTIEYSTTETTSGTVVATLHPSEDVIVTNNGEYRIDENGNVYDQEGNILNGYTADAEGYLKDPDGNIIKNINTFTYEFLSNGKFTFEFIDKAGNKGTAVATVNWIDTEEPNATFSYSTTVLTNKDVIVTIQFDEGTIIKNNGGKNTYTFTQNGEFTFTFEDEVGNQGEATAKVDWIDKLVPTAEVEYDKSHTNKAIVRIVNPSKEITFKDGNGTYEFTKNGTYEIEFYDQLGNKGKVTVIIDWLKSDLPINPDVPENPSIPTDPSTPADKPENPSIPTDPSIPDDKPENPSTPINPSVPENSGQSSNKPNTGNTIVDNDNQSSNVVTNPSDEMNPDEVEQPNTNEEEKPTITPDDKPSIKPDHSNSGNNQGIEIVEDKKKNNYVIPIVATTVIGVLSVGFFISKIK